MKTTLTQTTCLLALAIGFALTQADEPQEESSSPAVPPPATVIEARARATLLHETIHGSLQVMHRDFFDEEDSRAIPSASLEDVFSELSRSYGVKVKWLVVETDIVNIDHKPQDQFEKDAAKALAAGNQKFEASANGQYRYAGPIRLASQCLKCHVRGRSNTDDRTAGLLISMPLADPNHSASTPN